MVSETLEAWMGSNWTLDDGHRMLLHTKTADDIIGRGYGLSAGFLYSLEWRAREYGGGTVVREWKVKA